MTDNPYELTLSLGLFELFFDPFEHAACVSRVPHQVPVHVVLSLSIHRNDLYVVQGRQLDAVIPSSPQHLISFSVKPGFPGLCKALYEHLFPLSLVVVDIDGEAFMVSHRRDDSDIGGFFQFLAFYEGVVKVVALSLLPDIMRSIVPSP